ncbi:MAG TPA: tRNA adenosine deaminase-associated protein [Micromonospora sp.]
MTYFAAGVARGPAGWTAEEVDLGGVSDLDEVVERLREVDPDADLSLLFVEADDSYLVIVRVDEEDDPRVFGSDSAFADESRLGAVLLGDVETAATVGSGASDAAATLVGPGFDPVGDPELLADLGVPGKRLLALCAKEGMLPQDVTAEICQAIGCGDQVEELREA